MRTFLTYFILEYKKHQGTVEIIRQYLDDAIAGNWRDLGSEPFRISVSYFSACQGWNGD